MRGSILRPGVLGKILIWYLISYPIVLVNCLNNAFYLDICIDLCVNYVEFDRIWCSDVSNDDILDTMAKILDETLVKRLDPILVETFGWSWFCIFLDGCLWLRYWPCAGGGYYPQENGVPTVGRLDNAIKSLSGPVQTLSFFAIYSDWDMATMVSSGWVLALQYGAEYVWGIFVRRLKNDHRLPIERKAEA